MYKEPQLNEFHKVVMDTIASLKKKITINKTEITKLQNKIELLKKQGSETQTKLDESLSKESSLVTLGIEFDKTAFPPLMYGIIVLLTLTTLVILFLFFRSNMITKETKKIYNDISEEFDAQKKRSLERETKLNRELQTERNKNTGNF